MKHSEIKQCSACRRWFKSGAFAFDSAAPSGLQSQCRACKADWETDGVLARTRAHILRQPARVIATWTDGHADIDSALLAFWEESEHGRCHFCGCRVSEWQCGGHALDRKNSKHGYERWNVVLCCWPDNLCKSDRDYLIYKREADTRKVVWGGAGRVQWDVEYSKRCRRRIPIDLSEFEVPDPQLSLFANPEQDNRSVPRGDSER